MNFFLYVVLICLFETARACGGFFCFPQQPIVQAGETIAFGVSPNDDGNQEVVMAVQIQYSGPASSFSWILPVMVEPELSVGYDGLFTELFERTRPRFQLNVNNDLSTTCPSETFEQDCAFGVFEEEGAGGFGPTILQEDTVGPYNTVVLQPAEENPGQSVFNWLQENDYDQPEESFALIDYYARQGQLFVALRLRKDAEVGDIQPIVLKYTMPPDVRNIACVPIQLTSIAATADMPIQIYVLSDARAFPVNYLDVELDDTQADWLGCWFDQNCFLNDMRARFASFLQEEGINDHAFVTEFARPFSPGRANVALDVDVNRLANTTAVTEIFRILIGANVPYSTLVNTIIERYIPKDYHADGNVPANCNAQEVYSIFTDFCAQFLTTQILNTTAATELARELNASLIHPANEAQAFVDSHTYLTRLYGQLSPDTMTKDPFFAFHPDLPDVSNIHEASAVPVCDENGVANMMDITVGNRTARRRAELFCGVWTNPGGSPFSRNNVSTAHQVSAFGYPNEENRILLRSETGNFSPEIVAEIVSFMDARVPNQTVLPYNPVTVSDPEAEVTDGDEDDAEDDMEDEDETEDGVGDGSEGTDIEDADSDAQPSDSETQVDIGDTGVVDGGVDSDSSGSPLPILGRFSPFAILITWVVKLLIL